jgi:hypothetical protein
LAQLVLQFFTEISNSYVKQQSSVQFISSTASQNELKADNKDKLFFNAFSDKLFFQQAVALLNSALYSQCVISITWPNQKVDQQDRLKR